MILDQNLKETESELIISDREIFTKIWTSPRLIFKYLNDNRYDKYTTVLTVLAGIARTFGQASSKNMGDNMSLIGVLALCIILGGLIGWIMYYITAVMINWTGKWLNGQGDTDSLLRVIAHAMIPSIITLLPLIAQISLFGNEIFQSNIDVYGNGVIPMIIFFTTSLLSVVLTIWTIIILVIGISEVQKISIGKSILNMILPGLIILVPILLIAFIIRLIS